MRKKLVEVALPLEAINVASAREKSIRHGHPSTLHLWWARRPLAAARAVIFTSLVDDPDNPEAPPEFVQACRELPKGKNAIVNDTPRMRLFDFIELLVQWESTTKEDVIGTARRLILLSTDNNPPPLLDPFAGGGSIPLEAQRLGLEAHASDLNPVAVMINKALIEIPPRFANHPPVNPRDRLKMGNEHGWEGADGLAADIRYYGEWMRTEAFKQIGHLYPKHNSETVIAWLWARTVKCPNPACGAVMPLISTFEVSKKKGKKAWIEPIIDHSKHKVRFTVKSGDGNPPLPPKTGRGANFRCLVCGQSAQSEYLKQEGMAGRMHAQLIAIITEGKNGRSYYSPNEEQESMANVGQPLWKPEFALSDDRRAIWCPLYGLDTFDKLFTSRQLVGLTTFSNLIAKMREVCYRDILETGTWLPKGNNDTPLRDGGTGARAYAEAVSVYLAFAVDRLTDRVSSLATWQNSADKVRGVFARQGIPMVWDYAEVNPFSQSSGNFYDNTEWVAEVVEAGKTTIFEKYDYITNVTQRDAVSPAQLLENALISTDPPYYDNIGYADLSDYFYVWLRPMLREIYPELFTTLLVPKTTELVASPYRFDGNKEIANRFFENGLRQVFSSMRHIMSIDYPLTVYYAFKQTESEDSEESDNANSESITVSSGWETMLTGLVQSGFVIDGTWPMRTERSVRTVSLGTNALASSIILVCRPRPESASTITRRQFIDMLRRELPNALKELQSGNIAPVDLAQASIGPGMAIYSRYSKVLEADGTALSVRAALGLINQELDAYLEEQDGAIDPDTRFAVTWFQQYGFNEGEFGVADVLARAKGTSVDGVTRAGVVKSGRGKVQLTHWREYDPGAWNPQTDHRLTVWEATHHLIERLNNHGEEGTGLLLAQLKDEIAAEARNLAYRLYNICERKGWSDHARDYNALVVQWAGAQEQATEAVGKLEQGKLGLS